MKMKKKKKIITVLLLTAVILFTGIIPAMAGASAGGEKWIDNTGNTSEPRNSRDVRNNTNGFDETNYTPVSYEGEVTLYAQNYGYDDDDNYDIKLYIKNNDGNYTQIGRLYGYGDNLRVEVFAGHSVTLVWQRHQKENKYYVVELTGPFSTTYKKDFQGSDTGYTSGNVYVKYNSASSGATPADPTPPASPSADPPAAPGTPKVGDALGDVLYSDIVAYINGHAIPTNNIGGNTYIVVEDLMRYGFDVEWDGGAKTLKVSGFKPNQTINPIAVEKETVKSGTVKYKYYYTDIKTYVSGKLVESFNIDGQTLIQFDELERYGTVNWDKTNRALRLTVR